MPLTRRHFIHLASLGTGLVLLPLRLVPQLGPSLRLRPHGDGRFSLLLNDVPLLSRLYLELHTDRGVLSSRETTLLLDASNPSRLTFHASSLPLDVVISTESVASGNGIALTWLVRSRDAKPVRIRALLLVAAQEEGGGLMLWDKLEDGWVLTDEWERCYGEAAVAPLATQSTFRSAWDIHFFDRRRQRTLSCGFYDLSPGMLSFAGGTGAGSRAADLSIRLSTRAGEEGVIVQGNGTFNAGSLLFLLQKDPPVDTLIRYAELIAERNRVTVSKPIPTGWVDWYFAKGIISGEDIVQNIDLIAKELRDFGLQYIQIDSGWQLGIEASPPPHNVIAGGPWIPNSKFSRGMAWYAARIREKGFTPGLWIRPFQEIDKAPDRSAHPSWFNEKGQMDISNLEVRKRVIDLCNIVAKEWGFAYVKYDFVAYDTFDEWGKNLFQDHAAVKQPMQQLETTAQAYCDAMRDIRSATEGRARLLSCNGLMPQTLGAADAYRIGDDVGDWERTFRNGVRSIAARFYTNGTYWWNDPDCLLVREPFTMEQARMWASLIAQTGGIVFISEDLRTLPAERLAIIKKVLPVYNPPGDRYHWATPADFLENNPPEIWVQTVKRDFAEWKVVGIYNWSATAKVKTVHRREIGLTSSDTYCATDFWNEAYVGEVGNELRVELPPWSCRLLAIHKLQPHPQIVGSSRHAMQGGVEFAEVEWNARQRVLSGKAHAVAGNPYTLMARVPHPFMLSRSEGVAVKEGGKIVRLEVSSPVTAMIAWRLFFH